jgi:ABC-type glycerol-3-phosphate transport system permease component
MDVRRRLRHLLEPRQFSADTRLIAPASFISLIVPLAVFLAFQRYFVQASWRRR